MIKNKQALVDQVLNPQVVTQTDSPHKQRIDQIWADVNQLKAIQRQKMRMEKKRQSMEYPSHNSSQHMQSQVDQPLVMPMSHLQLIPQASEHTDYEHNSKFSRISINQIGFGSTQQITQAKFINTTGSSRVLNLNSSGQFQNEQL